MSVQINQKRRDQSSRNNNSIEVKSVINGQKPSCIIEVFGFATPNETKLDALNVSKPLTKRPSDANGTGPIRIDNDIVKCTIHKNKNSSSGGFSLILKRGNKESGETAVVSAPIDYLKVLAPGDWIMIYMRADDDIKLNNSEDSGLKMLGIIENVRYVEVDDPTSGRPRFEYVVTGRDFGKVFESQIFFNPVINDPKLASNLMGGDFNTYVHNVLKKRTALSPDEIAKAFISYFLADGKKNSLTKNTAVFRLPSTLLKKFGGRDKFSDIFDDSFIGLQKFSDGKFTGVSPLLGQAYVTSFSPTGTIWSFLKAYSNRAINEMFVDLAKKDGKLVPTFQLRQIPLSQSSTDETNAFTYNNSSLGGIPVSPKVSDGDKTLFRDLPQHKIKSPDIKQKNIGKNDHERVNSVVIVPQDPVSGGQEKKAAYAMMFNSPSVKKYGQRVIRSNTMFVVGEALKSIVQKQSELVTDFFMLAHAFYNGTIVTDGTDDFVQVGQNLFIEDVKQLFHINGISYIYEIDQNTGATMYNTEFRVSHGQKLSNGRLEFIGKPQTSFDLQYPPAPEKLEYATIPSNTIENIRNKK